MRLQIYKFFPKRKVFLVSSFRVQGPVDRAELICALEVSSFRFQVSGFKFQVSGFKFQVSSFRFSFADIALSRDRKRAFSPLDLRNGARVCDSRRGDMSVGC